MDPVTEALTASKIPVGQWGKALFGFLTDNFEWHLVGAYHIDGRVYGPDLGPDGTVAEQFGFIHRNGN